MGPMVFHHKKGRVFVFLLDIFVMSQILLVVPPLKNLIFNEHRERWHTEQINV